MSYDSRFEHTCPGCDNTEGLAAPAAPLRDENEEDYQLECPKCGLQWQPGQYSWPDEHDLVEESIREVLTDWGRNPRREAERRAQEAQCAALRVDLRRNPPRIEEHTPLPWAVSRQFSVYVVPAGDEKKPIGAAVDPVQNAEYARVVLTLHASRLISEREARANALLIVEAVNYYAQRLGEPDDLDSAEVQH